jgi:esterase/lipase
LILSADLRILMPPDIKEMMRRISGLFISLLVAGFLVSGCGAKPPRLQESGLNSRFPFSNDLPFAEYIRQTEQMIMSARADINAANRAVILDANLPFELKPDSNRYPPDRNGRYEKGILFLHGLSDSPYLVKAVSRHFQTRGFLVRSILLPGHGTVPGDLLQVTSKEWIRATEYGVHQMKSQVENLYMAGFSTGGALCVHEALKNPTVKGLVLFSPALGIKSSWAFMADYMKIFSDWLGGERDDRDYAKYESFAVNGAAQLYHLIRENDAAFAAGKRLGLPVFCALSKDDISVDAEEAMRVFKHYVPSAKSMMILYSRTEKEGRQDGDPRLIYKNSYYPKDRIAGFSHISLLIPPNDPHYGRNGDYKSCLHYQGDTKKRMSCEHDPAVWQGEITGENLRQFTLRRLTYNPRYHEMISDLDHFLEGCTEGNP